MSNQENFTSGTSLSGYFDSLSVLLENTLQSLNAGDISKDVENKLPEAFSEMAFLGAAQACISQASERIQNQINNNISIINKSNSTFEQAFKKEEESIVDFINNKTEKTYKSDYEYNQNKSKSTGKFKQNSDPKPEVVNAGADSVKSLSPDAGKMKVALSNLTEKIKNSTDEEKNVMAKYIPDMITFFVEFKKTYEFIKVKEQ